MASKTVTRSIHKNNGNKNDTCLEGWGVGDTHFTRDMCTGIHISRGYTYHLTRDHPKGSQRNVPVQKHNDLLLIEKKLFGKKKQGNKKEKLTESLHLTVKIARRSNYNFDLRKLRVNKINGRQKHKAALTEKPTDSTQ